MGEKKGLIERKKKKKERKREEREKKENNQSRCHALKITQYLINSMY